MLDIDKLDKQFDEILSSFTEEKIQQWLDFAEERETIDRLFNGESVNLNMEKLLILCLHLQQVVFLIQVLY